MGLYLNPGNEEFRNAAIHSKIYVDKTEMIKFTNSQLFGEHKNICVSRPRRFGKSMAANMLVAYYSKGCDSKELFENFKIADDADENSVRFESPDGQRYKAKEMLILSYLQIHTPAAVKFYGEESPLLHDMMQIKETAQDKTVAEFPGANKVTVSQRHKTWQQKLLRIRAEQEDV